MNIDIDEDILKWVIDPIGVLGVLHNPQNDRIIRSGQGYEIFDEASGTNTKARGLLTPLAECFWPQTLAKDYKKRYPTSPALAKKQRRIALKRKKQRKHHHQTKATNALTATRGFSRGSNIHREAEDLITMDVVSFHKRHRTGAHPWTMALMSAIADKYQWKPLVSEFLVADEVLGMATEIDQIWVDKRGVLQFLEVKSGYSTTEEWLGAKGSMTKSLKGIFDNSACDRAIVQIMMGTMMALNGHGLRGCRYACWVIHVNDNGVEFVPVLPALIDEMGPLVHQDLLDHQLARRRERDAKRNASLAEARAKKRKMTPKRNKNYDIGD